MKKTLILFCLVTFIVASVAQAQPRRYKSGTRAFSDNFYGIWKFTAGAGIASYKGDLGGPPDAVIRPVRPDVHVGAQYRLTSRWSLKSEFGWYRIAASDEKGKNPQRNASFRSDNFEGYVAGMFDLRPYSRRYTRTASNPLHPYLFAGIGFTTLSPQAQINNTGTWYNLRDFQTEGVNYSPIALTLPLGVGVRWRLTRAFDMSVEMSYRFTSSDYLDDVSTDYPADFVAGAVADPIRNALIAPGDRAVITDFFRKRGDPSQRDGFFTLGIKIEYNTVPYANYGRGASRKQPKYRRK